MSEACIREVTAPEASSVRSQTPTSSYVATAKDIVVANTYAKSLLGRVARQWAAMHENADYFPSYEIVLNSDRAAACQPDLRHARFAAVHHVMDVFLRHYFE